MPWPVALAGDSAGPAFGNPGSALYPFCDTATPRFGVGWALSVDQRQALQCNLGRIALFAVAFHRLIPLPFMKPLPHHLHATRDRVAARSSSLSTMALASLLLLHATPAQSLDFSIDSWASLTVSTNYGTVNDRLMLMGCGTLFWTGSINPLQGTVVDCGTLSVGNGGLTGSIDGDIYVSDGALIFNRSNAMTYSGAVTGFAPLVKQGAGTLTLTGTVNTGARIQGGRLAVGNGGLTGSVLGAIVNDGVLSFNRSDDLTVRGPVSGTGSLVKEGNGTLVLTGTNTYAGGTTIQAGRLVVGDGATSGSITGNVANSGTLAINRSDAVTFDGMVTGKGSLVKQGTNTLTLIGYNQIGGGTTIQGGTLVVGDGGTRGWLSGYVTNNGTLVFNRSDDDILPGMGGTGTLVKRGTGTLFMLGSYNHTGGTTIESGSLMVGRGFGSGGSGSWTTTGEVINHGQLIFNQPAIRDFASAISGTGSLVLEKSTFLTLLGKNSYSGGTVLKWGSALMVEGSGSITGDVATEHAASLTFSSSEPMTFSGSMSGVGSLMKYGTGNLTLTGDNTNFGIGARGGTVVVGDGATRGSITGNVTGVTADSKPYLHFNRSDAVTYRGLIRGTVGLAQIGTGTLSLTGNNSYTGGTVVAAGTLIVGDGANSGWITGDVVNNGVLAFNRTGQQIFDGAISGVGTLIKQGQGTLVLTGTNTAWGDTVVQAGELRVNGNSTNSVTRVGDQAVLSGRGHLAALEIDGTVSPGDGVGTLNATTASFQAGSGYLWEIRDAGMAAGIGYDILTLRGMLDLSAVGVDGPVTVSLKSLGPTDSPGIAQGFDASRNAVFTLVSSDAIQGFDERNFVIDSTGFANDTAGGSWYFSATDQELRLNFATAVAAVPEPQGWALMLSGLAVVAAAATARRRHVVKAADRPVASRC